jgi:hypothetical protein
MSRKPGKKPVNIGQWTVTSKNNIPGILMAEGSDEAQEEEYGNNPDQAAFIGGCDQVYKRRRGKRGCAIIAGSPLS